MFILFPRNFTEGLVFLQDGWARKHVRRFEICLYHKTEAVFSALAK